MKNTVAEDVEQNVHKQSSSLTIWVTFFKGVCCCGKEIKLPLPKAHAMYIYIYIYFLFFFVGVHNIGGWCAHDMNAWMKN